MNETQAYQLTWTQLVVLKVLSRHRLHGRGINRVIKQVFGRELSHSTLYPAFRSLSTKGLIVGPKPENTSTIEYTITTTGIQVLAAYELAFKQLGEYDINVYCKNPTTSTNYVPPTSTYACTTAVNNRRDCRPAGIREP